jgi:hypothetical protein
MVIQVKHQPRKQVIIHEMAIYDSAQQFVDLLTVGLPPGTISQPLRWINGVLLSFNPLPATTEFIAKERAKGILHWDHVSFAPLEKFIPQIISQNNIAIDITDVSKNETFQAISKLLIKKLKKK